LFLKGPTVGKLQKIEYDRNNLEKSLIFFLAEMKTEVFLNEKRKKILQELPKFYW